MTGTIREQIGQPRLGERVGAALYDLLNARLDQRLFGDRRRRLLAVARGRVLDVGAGTGANLPHYRKDQVTGLVLLDVGRGMLARAGARADGLGVPVELRLASAERLPFADASFDTVVFTLSLCSIPDPIRALREAGRALKPGGKLLVLEHVRAQDPGLARWQDRLTPLQKALGSGCHPNRDTRRSIEAAGFVLESVEEWLETRVPVPWTRPWLQAVASREG
ncbi:MAG TPA: methyltransferase domain-containing protein [Candidatus Eisenbacteria bacterium]|nr:methyltransferase domain-containing protein [Candidatus Eisenbacteria bacterium]